MRTHLRAAAVAAGLALLLSGIGATAQTTREARGKNTVEEIRKELMQLPYYSVFDFLAFKYDQGAVTLMGYAYHPGLKQDAERAVKRAAGVDQVINKIEDLPPSPMDDELRWKIYYSIYTDPFLSRYAPGGGLLWGHRHPFPGAFRSFDFPGIPGMEPAGDYPIHVIVKNGRVRLLGVVDNDSDKTIAGMKARQVPGSFEVSNELALEKSEPKSTRR